MNEAEAKLRDFMVSRKIDPDVAALIASINYQLVQLQAVVYAAGKTLTNVVENG